MSDGLLMTSSGGNSGGGDDGNGGTKKRAYLAVVAEDSNSGFDEKSSTVEAIKNPLQPEKRPRKGELCELI
jgi:hypothetical protein